MAERYNPFASGEYTDKYLQRFHRQKSAEQACQLALRIKTDIHFEFIIHPRARNPEQFLAEIKRATNEKIRRQTGIDINKTLKINMKLEEAERVDSETSFQSTSVHSLFSDVDW